MQGIRYFLLISGILFFWGCDQEMDIEQQKQQLMDTDRAFSALSAEKGTLTAFEAFMADEAIMYRSLQDPIRSRENIREVLAASGQGVLTWEPFQADVAASGDLGYTLGKYTYTYQDDQGTDLTSHGYYISVWKRQANGKWKWVFDGGIQGPPDNYED